MNLQDFPMDVQRCPITIESCECSLFWFLFDFTEPEWAEHHLCLWISSAWNII